MFKYFATADLLVASATDTDQLKFGLNSNKLCDYLVSGRPILLAANAPIDPVTESGAGFTIKPENPELMKEYILKVFRMTPEERIALGKNGYNYALENLDIKVLTNNLISTVFNKL